MFEKVLIANRGEIALRLHRACREMGIRTVAVHSTADADAMHVRLADEAVCIGPPSAAESYLNIPTILAAAEITGSDGIHPGYGFLSENPDFAQIVEEHGYTFIGPSEQHIKIMGDKIQAKKTVRDLGLKVVPGSDGAITDSGLAKKLANEIGYPVLIKAASGGGGRGMKLVRHASELETLLEAARVESKAAFNDDAIYLEKYLEFPRHIEVQIIGDGTGRVVHLGERDCSLQRRNQKIIEEAPSPGLNDATRKDIGQLVVNALSKINYTSLGTVEFLYEDGEFYFIEMNTRLQVEHPVTEAITGIDLVQEQIRIASGAHLSFDQKDVRFSGHAIECRINAEHPKTFAPSPGLVTDFHAPGGLGIRVDSGLYAGYRIPPYYDSLIAKLVAHGTNRNDCLMRLNRALGEFVIDGIEVNIPLHTDMIQHQIFLDGNYHIHWLEEFLNQPQ